MNTILFNKGKHDNASIWTTLKLIYISLFCKGIVVRFTDESKYIQSNIIEQRDWLKLIGRKSIWHKRINGVWIAKTERIWVVRYNPKENIYEITKYKRDDYQKDWDREVIKLPLYDYIYLLFDNFFLSLWKTPIPITAWFGGTLPAPSDVEWFFEIKSKNSIILRTSIK